MLQLKSKQDCCTNFLSDVLTPLRCTDCWDRVSIDDVPWHSLFCHFSRTVFYFHVRDFRHSRRGLLGSNCRRATTKVKLIDANMMRFISRLSIPFPFPSRVISRRPNKLRFAGPRDHQKREGHHANRKKAPTFGLLSHHRPPESLRRIIGVELKAVRKVR